MSLKAKEREETLLSLLQEKDSKILIKFGLKTDTPEENGEKEHFGKYIIKERK